MDHFPLPRHSSAELPRKSLSSTSALEADDFRDVFGGPPRSLGRFSGELSPFAATPSPPYDEAFRPPKVVEWETEFVKGNGRKLPEFRIAERRGGGFARIEQGFYDDILGLNCGVAGDRRSRTRSKSKSKCSSGLSSEDVSPLVRGDGGLSSFASKLRPIKMPYRHHYSPPSTVSVDDQNSSSTMSINPYSANSYFLDPKDTNKTSRSSDLYRQRSHMGFSCCFSPPDTISLEGSFRRNYMQPLNCDNSGEDSPYSVMSSIFPDPKEEKAAMEIEGEVEEPERLYPMRFNGNDNDNYEGAADVDEAIAWAKQKFWSHQTSKGDDEQGYSSGSKSTM